MHEKYLVRILKVWTDNIVISDKVPVSKHIKEIIDNCVASAEWNEEQQQQHQRKIWI